MIIRFFLPDSRFSKTKNTWKKQRAYYYKYNKKWRFECLKAYFRYRINFYRTTVNLFRDLTIQVVQYADHLACEVPKQVQHDML